MKKFDEQVLKVTKEILAKFIEVGRITPSTFHDSFKSVYKTVREAILENGFYEEKSEESDKGK